MKAAVCRVFGEPLLIEDVEIAAPGPGEVMVKMKACAICHSDITYMNGGWGGKLPAVYGHEGAGIVETVGAGVNHIQPGDHVVVTLIRSCGSCHFCAQGHHTGCETVFPLDENSPLSGTDGGNITHGLRTGAFAEYAVVDASQLAVIAKELSFDCASLLGCGVITGLGAVWNTVQMPAGANAAIIGCGGVGLNAVQGAALKGARTVIAMDLAQDKLAAAMEFGATHTVDPSSNDAVEQVKALTGGRGADYVFVTVGAKIAIEQSLQFLSAAGSSVLVGMPPSGVRAEFEPVNLADASQKIIGSKMGGTRVQIDIPMLVSMYQQGRLKLDELVTGRYQLDEINEAIGSVMRGEALRNVIVF